MSDKGKVTFTVLDGTQEEQMESTEKFLGMMTEEQKEQSMSDKYAYLDD